MKQRLPEESPRLMGKKRSREQKQNKNKKTGMKILHVKFDATDLFMN